MSRYLAAYDISHPSQRRKVAGVLAGYGIRMQRSVFEVDIEPHEIDTLKRRLGPLLGKDDAFDLTPIDRGPRPRLRWQADRQGLQSVTFL